MNKNKVDLLYVTLRIYKGKGKKGKCSNERGITLSSNFFFSSVHLPPCETNSSVHLPPAKQIHRSTFPPAKQIHPGSPNLHIGPPSTLQNEFTLGPQTLEATDTYKYLGITLNTKGDLTDHLKITKGKTLTTTQTIINLASSAQPTKGYPNGNNMETI